MDFKKSYAIMANDLSEVFSSKAIYMPMIAVPTFFAIMLPILTFYVSTYNISGIASRIIGTATAVVGTSSIGGPVFMAYFSVYVLGPIFMTMPIFTASVIAADSFAGEKERKTSEALLSTPITIQELLIGKMAASFLPAVVLTLAVFAIYGSVTNYLAYKAFNAYLLPNLSWILMIAMSPFLSLAAIGIVVLVSAHVQGIKEAQQISSLLILPVLVLPFTSIFGVVDLTPTFFAVVMLFLIVADLAIIYFGIKSFKKESIL
ncbi:MAG: ABC transporter permease subunit [Candidatus Micrarchaeota archaeon]|nr:ABC transporter permease subunit [Candidatus Micrarchaeota archaeon]MDE1834466.1 ABC transporter permease subunit [Candidatus Micrarchaeota archaeon]MDE1859388.1 ABC transporter permease subunit [Candidatus Micrarchaeota archaeon]